MMNLNKRILHLLALAVPGNVVKCQQFGNWQHAGSVISHIQIAIIDRGFNLDSSIILIELAHDSLHLASTYSIWSGAIIIKIHSAHGCLPA